MLAFWLLTYITHLIIMSKYEMAIVTMTVHESTLNWRMSDDSKREKTLHTPLVISIDDNSM